MKISLRHLLLVTSLALAYVPAGVSQEVSIEKCQKLKDRIEHYTNLRRGGGSASRMDKWKRSRQQKEDEFNQHQCWHYRGQMK